MEARAALHYCSRHHGIGRGLSGIPGVDNNLQGWNVIQPVLDFSGYIKFFIGLFALINPVGILPIFISMTNYQGAEGRSKTNLTANVSVVIILWGHCFSAT
ncbi:hypothetical protein HAT93_03942 [Dickeya solani]|nr:hypothetical protein [Dickeya solani]QKO13830.1 hypothetical protein HAT91_02200 [Dickeya solani]